MKTTIKRVTKARKKHTVISDGSDTSLSCSNDGINVYTENYYTECNDYYVVGLDWETAKAIAALVAKHESA